VLLNAAVRVILDALRWCQRLGVGVLVLGSDGTAQLASTPRMTDNARAPAIACSERLTDRAQRRLVVERRPERT
jgi:hypothetical protein